MKNQTFVDDIDDTSVEDTYRIYVDCYSSIFKAINLEIETIGDHDPIPLWNKISDEYKKCPINLYQIFTTFVVQTTGILLNN